MFGLTFEGKVTAERSGGDCVTEDSDPVCDFDVIAVAAVVVNALKGVLTEHKTADVVTVTAETAAAAAGVDATEERSEETTAGGDTDGGEINGTIGGGGAPTADNGAGAALTGDKTEW